jgi:hypothetical protein
VSETVTPREIAAMANIEYGSVGAWIRRARLKHGLTDTGERDPETTAKLYLKVDIQSVLDRLTGPGDFSKGDDRAPRYPKQPS